MSALTGYIDSLSTRHIEGWAVGPDGGGPHLNVFVNDALVTSGFPSNRRPDLDHIHKESMHGFRFDFQNPIPWGAVVSVRNDQSAELTNSPATVVEPDVSWLNSAPKVRAFLSHKFIKGEGLEIGALDRPLPVSPGVNVRYVDRLPLDELRKHYPEMPAAALKAPDIVADAQELSGVEHGRYDFVIANHVIEHMEDPIRALQSYSEVLKPGGVIFLAVPDKRKTFDQHRPLTSNSHLLSDHRENGTTASRTQHYREWATLVVGKHGAEADKTARELNERDYSIHFHVWDPLSFVAFINEIRNSGDLAVDLEMIVPVDIEFVVLLRKL